MKRLRCHRQLPMAYIKMRGICPRPQSGAYVPRIQGPLSQRGPWPNTQRSWAMAKDFNPTEWITTAEAAKLTEYAVVHLRQLAQHGKIKALKKGRDWLLNKASVLAYAKKMQQLGTEKHDPWRSGARQKDAKAQ